MNDVKAYQINPSNVPRVRLLTNLLTQFNLNSLALNHPTHHHFMGKGVSDSQLDVLLYPSAPHPPEALVTILCSKENPLITSHHDMVISSFSCTRVPYKPPPLQQLSPQEFPITE